MRIALRLAGFVVASFLALSGSATAAAGDGDPQSQQAQPRTAPRRADFLFGQPKASIGIRGGWVFASAGSDLFDFVTRELTLDKEHFNSPAFATDVAFAITSRAQIEAGFEFNRMTQGSEYREFVDNNLQPIEQTTSLKTMHFTGAIRYALTPRGYEVSSLAWVPRRVVPFVGAGGGAVFYQFRQNGDFVDFADFSVFQDAFRSQGWAPSAFVFGGVDMQIYKGLYGTVQGRYTKAAADLSSDFIDFDPIDLSGFRLSAGVNVVF